MRKQSKRFKRGRKLGHNLNFFLILIRIFFLYLFIVFMNKFDGVRKWMKVFGISTKENVKQVIAVLNVEKANR